MDKFCVITNYIKDQNFETTKYVKKYLEDRNKKCVITYHESEAMDSNNDTDISLIPEDTECAIVLGGDGTIIRAAKDLLEMGIPIFGINLGTLGFLTEIEQSNIDIALDKLILDECRIEKRMMLLGKVNHDGEENTSNSIKEICHGYAMNDVVVARSDFSRIISVTVYANGEYVDTYTGDGVIISTPTGSTGYNLSAGGPIVTPYSKAMLITPICPHALMNRSIIVSAEDQIKIIVGENNKRQRGKAIVTFDGNEGIELDIGDYVEINKARLETQLVKISNTSFFEILRNKFNRDKE